MPDNLADLTEARVLTVRQPWASLIALGVKRIEARTFATKYRGPVLVQAAAADTDRFMHRPENRPAWERLGEFIGGNAPVRGAVIAVANLSDSLPVVDHPADLVSAHPDHSGGCLFPDGDGITFWCGPDTSDEEAGWFDDQPPFCANMLVPGNFGWVLEDVRPVEPIPHKGGLGLRHATPDLIAAVNELIRS